MYQSGGTPLVPPHWLLLFWRKLPNTNRQNSSFRRLLTARDHLDKDGETGQVTHTWSLLGYLLFLSEFSGVQQLILLLRY